MMKKIRCQRSKYIFMNMFLFAAWNIGFAFGAARLVKGCEYRDEISLHYIDTNPGIKKDHILSKQSLP